MTDRDRVLALRAMYHAKEAELAAAKVRVAVLERELRIARARLILRDAMLTDNPTLSPRVARAQRSA